MFRSPGSGFVHASPVARRLLFHLHTIGHGYLDGAVRLSPFTKPGACLVWITQGGCRLELNGVEWEMKRGPEFWLYGAESTRAFVPVPGEQMRQEAFWFGGPGLDAWLEELDAKRQPCFRLRYPARIYRAYREMCGLTRRRPPDWECQVHVLLAGVLAELLRARQSLNPSAPPLPPPLVRALNAVETDPGRAWRVRELAALAGLNQSTFGALFLAVLHQSPHAYLQRARVDQARVLLADPNLRIKEIAQRLHFCSGHYFSYFFHQQTGSTPTEFRAHLERRAQRATKDD